MAHRIHKVQDTEGWSYGVKAALRTLFGTDTELRLRFRGVDAEVKAAEQEVGRMAAGAVKLMVALKPTREVDEVNQEFEDIIKDVN